MDQLRHDVRFALRSILRNPGISLVAVISLALGIGANASIFSAVDVFMLKPLPFPEADELVTLRETNPERGIFGSNTSMPTVVDWRNESQTMEIAGFDDVGLNISGGDQPERLGGLAVTHNFFDVLRVQPARGRGFLPEEEREGSGSVLVISDGLWQRSFGGDPEILGQVIGLDGEQYTVVGVMAPNFEFDSPLHEIWIPMENPGEGWRATHYMEAFGRIRSGSSVELAQAEIGQIQTRLGDTHPELSGWSANVVPLSDQWFGVVFKQAGAIASVAVFLVLLIACANVANLLLARGAGRTRAIALRGALGAGRRHIARQLLTESVILAFVGGAAGLVVAVLGIRGVVSLIPPAFPRIDEIGLQPRTLVFTAMLALASGLIFGILPAFRASRSNLRDALGEGERGGAGGRSRRLQNAFVIAQISLATVLLISATLLVKSFAGLRSVELGFGTDDVVTATIALPEAKYPEDADVSTFLRELLTEIRALPGVTEAGGTSGLPMGGLTRMPYSLPGRPAGAESPLPDVSVRLITPGYMEAMSVPLVAGSGIEDDDVHGTPGVAVINERFVERHWTEESPLGQTIAFGETVVEIVGVVGNTRDLGPNNLPPAMVYQAAYQGRYGRDGNGNRRMSFAVQAATDPSSLIAGIRARVRAADPEQPIYSVATMATVADESLSLDLGMVKVLSALALIACILAAVGVYGVLAYSVARRTQEMGIRMALGATTGDILKLVVGQGTTLALVGIGVGLLAAFASTRGLAFFLVGVDPVDLQVFSLVTVLLLLTSMAASYLPALRATGVDTMTALRPD